MSAALHYLQEQEGIYLAAKARKVAPGGTLEGSIGNFSEYIEAFFEHGIFRRASIYGHIQVIDNNTKNPLVYN